MPLTIVLLGEHVVVAATADESVVVLETACPADRNRVARELVLGSYVWRLAERTGSGIGSD
jgi:hypothetical protein